MSYHGGMASSRSNILLGVLLLGSIGAIVFQQRILRQSREREHQETAQRAQSVAMPNPEPLMDTNELLRLRIQERELIRLRGEVTLLRREREMLSNQLATVKTQSPAALRSTQSVDRAWVEQVLNGPLTQQGLAAGTLRGKFIRGEGGGTRSELALQDALQQRQLNQTLERSPGQFADFQAAFIQGVVGLSDSGKIQQIHDLLRHTYEQAVANGLDIPSKPATETDAWVQRRFQLDRHATAAVENLLTPEERTVFGRAFIGVMGVDLGAGVDRSNYPKGFLGPEP